MGSDAPVPVYVGVDSGAGDGGYPVWVGRDEAGRAAVVVTDFGLGGLAALVALARPAPAERTRSIQASTFSGGPSPGSCHGA